MIKNVLVTGCSRGLGLKICERILDEGSNIFGVSRTLTQEFSLLMKQNPLRVKHLAFDLSDTQSVKNKIFNEFISNETPIHAFINNAAVAYDDIITNLNIDKLKTLFEVNVFTPYVITKYAIRNSILNRSKLAIVHISSISAHTGYKGLAMYAGSKGALEAFSKNTAREWGERNIRSNCLVAGFMETDMSKGLTDDHRKRIYNRTSLKSATSIQSVADSVAFLISDNSCSITGQNIFVDAGTI